MARAAAGRASGKLALKYRLVVIARHITLTPLIDSRTINRCVGSQETIEAQYQSENRQ